MEENQNKPDNSNPKGYQPPENDAQLVSSHPTNHPHPHHQQGRQVHNHDFPPPTKPTSRFKKLWHDHKRAIIIGSCIGLSLITVGSLWYVQAHRQKPKVEASATPSPSPTEPPKPITKASALTGVEVDPIKADQPVMASVVENLGDPAPNGARPQSGLSSAGVVYEALAEGGITRYLALWQADVPLDIGPVRSLRPVFFDTAMEYGAPVGHAGGSTDALNDVRNSGTFKDLDYSVSSSFRRVSTRYAPHNLYIYGKSLSELVTAKGWGNPPTFTPWPRKDDAPAETATASVITANFSGPLYKATFTYDKATNSYTRAIGGKPDVDANNNQPIKPKSVIVIMAINSYGQQPNGKPKNDIDIVGTGKGYIFQDGTATQVTWTKSSSATRMKFTDANGEIKLNRGQSWVSILPIEKPVSYQ